VPHVAKMQGARRVPSGSNIHWMRFILGGYYRLHPPYRRYVL
jgi:hypothetical protein